LTEPIRDFWIPVFLKPFLILRLRDSISSTFSISLMPGVSYSVTQVKRLCTKLKMQKKTFRFIGGKKEVAEFESYRQIGPIVKVPNLIKLSLMLCLQCDDIRVQLAGLTKLLSKMHQLTANFAIV
jgi:hypothetical protein